MNANIGNYKEIRKCYCIIGAVLFLPLLLLAYIQENYRGHSFKQVWSKHRYSPVLHSTTVSSRNTGTAVVSKPAWDYLTEEEVIADHPVTDEKLTPSLLTSTVTLMGNRTVYHVGDDIKLFVTLRNGYNVSRIRGGDQLRVRGYSEDLHAYAPGYVIDHNNGSYTAVVRASWPGHQKISLRIAYSREKIRVVYYIRQELPATRMIVAQFKSGVRQEQTYCHPVRGRLTNYTDVCNFTLLNGGESWYCGKPRNQVLLCEDWTNTKIEIPYSDPFVTPVEDKLLGDITGHVFPSVDVYVKGTMDDRRALPACSSYPKRELWTNQKPTGFFFNNTWYLHHCNVPSILNLKQCMRNTHLMITGDSTTRHWYKHILQRFSCQPVTETWTREKWHKRSACKIPEMNFTMEWLPHGQPFAVGVSFDVNKYTLNALSRQINEMPTNQNVVYVIHMFMHTLAYHHSVFRDRMHLASRSVKHLLEINKNVKVLIKGPHTYIVSPDGAWRLSDYYAYVYRDIAYEEFKELHDNVTYMDQKDMTIAKAVFNNHPPSDVVKEAVNQMFAYVCE